MGSPTGVSWSRLRAWQVTSARSRGPMGRRWSSGNSGRNACPFRGTTPITSKPSSVRVPVCRGQGWASGESWGELCPAGLGAQALGQVGPLGAPGARARARRGPPLLTDLGPCGPLSQGQPARHPVSVCLVSPFLTPSAASGGPCLGLLPTALCYPPFAGCSTRTRAWSRTELE